ncbi:MAG: hypothetical protein IJR83_04800 [Clostridia bacterium]|nr:hypothetical protein [Clostridia bacterium]
MRNRTDSWIWLPEKGFEERQKCFVSALLSEEVRKEYTYTVVLFSRTYRFDAPITRVSYRTGGDTMFILRANGRHILRGPASAGGDFLFNEEPRPNAYAYEGEFAPERGTKTLTIKAYVRMCPVKICEYSKGHGGFTFTADIETEDGNVRTVRTDRSWTARLLPDYLGSRLYREQEQVKAVKAVPVSDIWHLETAPIPPCTEEVMFEYPLKLGKGQKRDEVFLLDRIWAGYLDVKITGQAKVSVWLFETDGIGDKVDIESVSSADCKGFELFSAGGIRIVSEAGSDVSIEVSFRKSHYPVHTCAVTETSDEELNEVLDVCRHTLKICRQTLHLDSPKHCEPLACTGDYYIESLMTAASFGDMRLAAFDVLRTAELLRHHDGRMFHTSYSLIWVRMLLDVFMFTGDRVLLERCEDALGLLLSRFERYLGGNGLIETPPDYMFVDWIYPDGVNMHHPPKCLGQTCLNLFYYGALRAAAEIYGYLERPQLRQKSLRTADSLKKSVIKNLWDGEKGLFFEGLNTPTPDSLLERHMPQNLQKRYYLKHSAILAVWSGMLSGEEARGILVRVMDGDQSVFATDRIQPYFLHYLLEAVRMSGLRERYTLKILDLWKGPVSECPKGLVEGFYPPHPEYRFDHSHAWGGTPLWSLPAALAGLEIIEPGFKRIALSPALLGLRYARVRIPAPQGEIRIDLEEGKKPEVYVPEGILA